MACAESCPRACPGPPCSACWAQGCLKPPLVPGFRAGRHLGDPLQAQAQPFTRCPCILRLPCHPMRGWSLASPPPLPGSTYYTVQIAWNLLLSEADPGTRPGNPTLPASSITTPTAPLRPPRPKVLEPVPALCHLGRGLEALASPSLSPEHCLPLSTGERPVAPATPPARKPHDTPLL